MPPRTHHRVCPVCGTVARYVTCGALACRQAYRLRRERYAKRRQRPDSDALYRDVLAQAAAQAAAMRDGRQHARPIQATAASVEAQFQAARAARLAREKTMGQRTYTITDGWAQKPGRSSMDGELRMSEIDTY